MRRSPCGPGVIAMQTPFLPIPDQAILSQLLSASEQAPVVLLKHDPFCGISLAAVRALATVPAPVHVVDVARQHELSDRLAERTGVRHESPQVLVLRGGAAAWSASHRAITAEAVQQALQAQTAAAR